MLHEDRERDRKGERERKRIVGCSPAYLLIRMTMVVMMAARKTNPPNTPRAIIPPEIENSSVDGAENISRTSGALSYCWPVVIIRVKTSVNVWTY